MIDPAVLNPRLIPYDFSLYLVTDTAMCTAAGRGVADTVAAAVTGGASVVQVREKHASDAEVLALTLDVFAALRGIPAPAGTAAENVPVFLDDRVEVVAELRRRGLPAHIHVGQTDMPPAQVRARLGAEPLLGLSAHTAEQFAVAAKAGGVDLFGVGPVWATRTKDVQRPALGVEHWTELNREALELGILAVAIGGIKGHNVHELAGAGALGVCVVSDICTAADPEAAARSIRAAYLGAQGENR
ncbi:thiamine phosphate synthase [Brevibacterium sp. 91QC2O2]|uniref:thiamine phosphate synthase n=1 Tax=Brevibacterium sp. 91QC2O2 TaxID=2968458 RepID=UPI00211B7C55|nr:thiamine phosphate synthase [Brevibacterium sp. 91QC2O2]MCQ9367462.1 thiamine phosphate synthase [Brevibacterium sp. 91QC2O2]